MTEEFVPEKWFHQTFNMFAFIPFSYGPANCVGRALARRELVAVSTAILQKFDMGFADSHDPRTYLEDLHDHFTTRRGKVLVNLSLRW